MQPVLSLRQIKKRYQAVVVNDITFEIQTGESVALVGANGAGKSTLIKLILGLVKPSSGEGTLYGHPFNDAKGRERVGYLPELPGYWGELSAVELLKFTAQLRKLSTRETAPKREQLLAAVGLKLRASRSMGGYSKGMLQRTGIAQVLLHDPDFFILDEPMSGLDPRAQEKLRVILMSLRAKGKTMLISSHSLEDIRSLCSRVIVLEKSKIVADGPTAEILDSLVEKYRSSEPWDEDPLGDWTGA